MSFSYKDIVVTPNKGSSTDDPKIVFSGANTSTNTDITLKVYPSMGGTLSFEGGVGQLFSISNTMSGTIFSVNDISGIPSIEVLDTGLIKLAQYSGNVAIGQSTANYKLDINGSIRANTFISNSPTANANTYLTGAGTYVSIPRSISITNYSGSLISVPLTGSLLSVLTYTGSTTFVPTN